MAITLTSDQRAALRRGAIAVRTLIDFHLDSGRFSFWDGHVNFTFDGTVYLAVADFGEVSAISSGQDLGAEGVELKLNGTKLAEASPDPLDPGALFGTIEDETYQLRRVDIRFAFFDADTGALLFTIKRYAGLIDQIRHVEEIDESSGKAQLFLVVQLESVARRYGQRGGRTRSHEDQQEIWAGDTFFKFTAPSINQRGSLIWGRKPAGQASGAGGGRASWDGPVRPVHV